MICFYIVICYEAMNVIQIDTSYYFLNAIQLDPPSDFQNVFKISISYGF